MGDITSTLPPASRGDGSAKEFTAHRMAARWWRRWTLLYLILLTAGTHWPSLSIGTGGGPPPDKVLHLFAFGGLTLLLWQCRLVKRIWLAGLIVAAWLLFDEWSQSLPILKRESSWEDIIAGLAGVGSAMMWVTATAPLGGTLSRWRRSLFDQIVDRRLSRFRSWISLGVAGIGIGILAAIMSVAFAAMFPLIISPRVPFKDPSICVLIAFCVAFIFAVNETFDHWWRKDRQAASVQQQCYQCGGDCKPATFDADGAGRCVHCDAPIHQTQWMLIERMSRNREWASRLNGAAVMVLGLSMFGVFLAVSVGYIEAAGEELPQLGLQTVAQLVGVVLVICLAVRIARLDTAQHYERQGVRCLRCDYDLSHLAQTPSGKCPECGTQFARLHNEASANR